MLSNTHNRNEIELRFASVCSTPAGSAASSTVICRLLSLGFENDDAAASSSSVVIDEPGSAFADDMFGRSLIFLFNLSVFFLTFLRIKSWLKMRNISGFELMIGFKSEI